MQNTSTSVKTVAPSIAPLKNVSLFRETMDRVINRAPHLPGIAAFFGSAGDGKSVAAAYTANRTRAAYVEILSVWQKIDICRAIGIEVLGQGVVLGKRPADIIEQVCEQLMATRQPLIIDEADHLVFRGNIELIRDIYERTHGMCPIMLIGEQKLESNLRPFERFHSRVLVWQQSQRADVGDVGALAELYAVGVSFTEDLLEHLLKAAKGSTRRVSSFLANAAEFAKVVGVDSFDLDSWEKQGGDAFVIHGAR